MVFNSVASVDDWTGDIKDVYERGYGSAIDIYDTATQSYLSGCSVDSTASRRGVSVVFTATVSAVQATQAQSEAVTITATALASTINQVSMGMGKQSSVPTASVASVQTPAVASASAQSSDSSGDHSGDMGLWVIIGACAAGIILVAIAVALLVRRCSDPAMHHGSSIHHGSDSSSSSVDNKVGIFMVTRALVPPN